MEQKTIKKSIDINAAKEKVWQILIQDEYTRAWYAEFSEGTHADTDWQEGSKAVFTDTTGNGIIGRVVINKPATELSLEYTGVVNNGREDYESEGANAVKGGRETYLLSATNGVTHLAIACDMDARHFETMSVAWDKALQKIKTLSEA